MDETDPISNRKHGVHCPQPIEIGIVEELSIYFSIFSYLEGEDAKDAHTFNTSGS